MIVLGLFLGAIVGVFLGVFIGPWASEIAFKIRPELETLTYIEAIVSGHYIDWLYHTHKTLATASVIISSSITGALFFIIKNNKNNKKALEQE